MIVKRVLYRSSATEKQVRKQQRSNHLVPPRSGRVDTRDRGENALCPTAAKARQTLVNVTERKYTPRAERVSSLPKLGSTTTRQTRVAKTRETTLASVPRYYTYTKGNESVKIICSIFHSEFQADRGKKRVTMPRSRAPQIESLAGFISVPVIGSLNALPQMRNKGPPLIELASLSETFNAHLDIPSDRNAAFSRGTSELSRPLIFSCHYLLPSSFSLLSL
ncbi:hypothetical protein DBV15_05178 [Temnothorax longispinosus]|uniref:Uncharacterized protein n=1 Tax=Temnothorax longispinosus TaxID=300112 RepID=A0A4S2KXC4_9HYME|nr:hypothetical protein DBV15_05178 [Temnothorax longispinosus]